MQLSKHLLLVACIFLSCAAGAASAQEGKYDKPVDLKPILPPVFPLPPKSQINPGSFGGNQTPYTTAPLQNSGTPTTPQTPGIKFTIPR
jgi:hypothetical protein